MSNLFYSFSARLRAWWATPSLKRRLAFSSAVFWVIAITTAGSAFLGFGQHQMLVETSQRNLQTASLISRDLNTQLSGIMDDARNFAEQLEKMDLNAQAGAAISLRISAPQKYRGIFFFDASGELTLFVNDSAEALTKLKVSDVLTRHGVDIDEQILEAYRKTLNTGIYVSEINYTNLESIPLIYFGLPANLFSGNRTIVVLQINLQNIWETINQITFGQTGFTYLASPTGLIIAHPDQSRIGQTVDPEISSITDGYEGFTEYQNSSGDNILVAYSPVGGLTGWGVVVEQSEDEAHAPIDRMGTTVIGIWVILAIVGTAAILRTIGSVTQPIMQLTEATNNIAWTGALSKIPDIERRDEVGQLSRAFNQMVERLQTTENKLEHAAEEERNRLARDLHDAVSQTLFSASIIAEVIPRIWNKNPEEGKRRLEEIRLLTRGALAEMRSLLFELRPAALAEAELRNLLHQLAESTTGRGRIPVSVSVNGECSPPVDVKIVYYRIAQEALNNIVKHSGATSAEIRMDCFSERLTMKIRDNGRGFKAEEIESGRLGMGIMRERAKDIGAQLTLTSQQGSGTSITLTWQAPET